MPSVTRKSGARSRLEHFHFWSTLVARLTSVTAHRAFLLTQFLRPAILKNGKGSHFAIPFPFLLREKPARSFSSWLRGNPRGVRPDRPRGNTRRVLPCMPCVFRYLRERPSKKLFFARSFSSRSRVTPAREVNLGRRVIPAGYYPGRQAKSGSCSVEAFKVFSPLDSPLKRPQSDPRSVISGRRDLYVARLVKGMFDRRSHRISNLPGDERVKIGFFHAPTLPLPYVKSYRPSPGWGIRATGFGLRATDQQQRVPHPCRGFIATGWAQLTIPQLPRL